MRVVVPYTMAAMKRSIGVMIALRATGHTYDMVHVGNSDRDYFDLLSSLWADGETFCIVEHDIVVHPTALDELAACPNDWCGFPHEYMGEVGYWLGCVKFGAGLIERHPDAMVRTGVLFDCYPKRHWYRLDPRLQTTILAQRGEVKCQHLPEVRHLGSCIPPEPANRGGPHGR